MGKFFSTESTEVIIVQTHTLLVCVIGKDVEHNPDMQLYHIYQYIHCLLY